MKKLITILAVALFTFSVNAQSFEVPKDYSLVKAEDYAPYEPAIVKCVDFLVNEKADENTKKRKKAGQFLFKWVSGAPKVMVAINPEVIPVSVDKNYLLIFMGGWTQRAIQTKDYKNNLEGNLAGIRAVIKYYKNNKKLLGKNKEIEKYIKLDKKGKLKDHIAKKLAKVEKKK